LSLVPGAPAQPWDSPSHCFIARGSAAAPIRWASGGRPPNRKPATSISPRRYSAATLPTGRSGHGWGPLGRPAGLVEVIHLGLLWHGLCAITRLEVPERLAAGPQPLAELATAVRAHQDALWRVLRLVADHHIVTLEGDRVGLTDRGRLLCRDHPSSLSAAFATVGNSDVAHGLTDTLRSGRAAAPRVLGMGYWEYLAAHPDQQALFDQPQVLEHARPFLDRQGVADRCRLHPGDLFAPPPPADLYLLASVLHDWDDPHAARILAALGHSANGTPGCGSSRCCCPPTPPRTGPR
jgi:hypothetical protein